MNIPDGLKTIQTIREQTDTVLLSFSGGKDAACAWLRLREHFPNIIPYYMYTVPDLQFIEKGLQWYENYFNTRIIRVPQPTLFKGLNTFTFQTPERVLWMLDNKVQFAEFDRDELRDMIVEHLGLQTKWTATGTSAYDNLVRRMAAHKHGAINHKRSTFNPIVDYPKQKIIDTLKEAKIKLPEEYKYFGRTFDGIGFQFVYSVKKYYPEDYERILEFYPLIEVEIKRYEFRKARGL